MKQKVRLGVLFGGRSGEHEVSVSSARSVVEAVDPDRFEVVPIGITKSGAWLLGESQALLQSTEVSSQDTNTVGLVADVTGKGLVPVDHGNLDSHQSAVDVVFPLLHGPYGEDGTVQGLLDLAGVAYVGAGVAASAIGMDKALMKAMFEHAGLPVPKYRVLTRREWDRDPDQIVADVERALGYPVFVKPARLGSSVGISKAKTRDSLWASIGQAMGHDPQGKVLVEEGINGREVECGLLGNYDPAISVFGEILTNHEFYDYEAKYTDGLADLIIPARLSADQIRQLSSIALRAFEAIDAAGMARVDFFIEHDTDRVVLNEINTIPGFAPTSMFPKLWEASGLSYRCLIERLVELAIERRAEQDRALR